MTEGSWRTLSPALQTGSFTTAVHESGNSTKLPSKPGVQCLLQMLHLEWNLQRPFSPNSQARVWDPSTPCLPSSPWGLQSGSCKLLYGVFITKLSALRPEFLFAWSSWAASFHAKYFTLYVVTYGGSLSTLLVKNLFWERKGAKRQGWHKACIGKRQMRSHLIQVMPSFDQVLPRGIHIPVAASREHGTAHGFGSETFFIGSEVFGKRFPGDLHLLFP